MAIFDKFRNIVSFWYSEPPPGLCFGEKVPRPTQPPLPAESFYHRRKTTEVATGFEPNLSTSMQTFDNFSTSRANMSPLMKKLSSLLLTPTVRMKTGLKSTKTKTAKYLYC